MVDSDDQQRRALSFAGFPDAPVPSREELEVQREAARKAARESATDEKADLGSWYLRRRIFAVIAIIGFWIALFAGLVWLINLATPPFDPNDTSEFMPNESQTRRLGDKQIRWCKFEHFRILGMESELGPDDVIAKSRRDRHIRLCVAKEMRQVNLKAIEEQALRLSDKLKADGVRAVRAYSRAPAQ